MRLLGLVLFLSMASAQASNYLNLYFIKSPLKIRWRSPQSLALSTAVNSLIPVRNRFYRHPISHAYVELKCKADSEEPIHLFGGMTTANDDEANKLLFKDKIGLGILYYVQQGRLQEKKEILNSIKFFKGKRRFNRLTVKVNEEACLRMVEFHKGWIEREYYKMYSGFNAVPRSGDGSGCAEYAMSFLEVAGVLDQEFRNAWSFKITPPQHLVGLPMTNNEVDFIGVLTDFRSRWLKEDNDFTLEVWEPGYMHRWVKKQHRKVRRGRYKGNLPLKVLNFNGNKNKGLFVDLSDRAVPTDPIWSN